MQDFATLQARLPAAWAANRTGSMVPHVVVTLPSFSVSEPVLARYADRIPSLEHRFLLAALMLPRIPGCEMVYLTCRNPEEEVLDYYAALSLPDDPGAFRRRIHIVEVPDLSARSITDKLIERPDLIAEVKRLVGGRLAMIEPWNVTAPEVELALSLGIPVNGTNPDLWPLGFKSNGRRLFERAGVPVPLGREGVHDVGEVAAAIDDIRNRHPHAAGVVVKHDNSGAGVGNHVVALRDPDGAPRSFDEVERDLTELPEWYVQDLSAGGVVEELISGEGFSSPSVQVDITPDGKVIVRSTHEQVLGGDTGQVYMGCTFPASQDYAVELAHHGNAVGHELATAGAVGRFSVDFVAVKNAEGWSMCALEINLRKGGTTHPYSVLRNLVPGRYDSDKGWLGKNGASRYYRSTDNLVDPSWRGLPPAEVIAAIDAAGLRFDRIAETGVVLHMLSCLAVDGRLGFTAIGASPAHAAQLADATRDAVHRCRAGHNASGNTG